MSWIFLMQKDACSVRSYLTLSMPRRSLALTLPAVLYLVICRRKNRHKDAHVECPEHESSNTGLVWTNMDVPTRPKKHVPVTECLEACLSLCTSKTELLISIINAIFYVYPCIVPTAATTSKCTVQNTSINLMLYLVFIRVFHFSIITRG